LHFRLDVFAASSLDDLEIHLKFNLTEQSLNIDDFKSESIPVPSVPHLRVFMRSASESDIERPPSPQASGRKRQLSQSESISAAQVLMSSLSTKAQQPVDLMSLAKVMVSLGESAPKRQLDLREMTEHFFERQQGGKFALNDTLLDSCTNLPTFFSFSIVPLNAYSSFTLNV
jgi:hypothetical protein